jgi:uncharacterized YccA/Bax inhibitor family protein
MSVCAGVFAGAEFVLIRSPSTTFVVLMSMACLVFAALALLLKRKQTRLLS